jgi:hypothetical protein
VEQANAGWDAEKNTKTEMSATPARAARTTIGVRCRSRNDCWEAVRWRSRRPARAPLTGRVDVPEGRGVPAVEVAAAGRGAPAVEVAPAADVDDPPAGGGGPAGGGRPAAGGGPAAGAGWEDGVPTLAPPGGGVVGRAVDG